MRATEKYSSPTSADLESADRALKHRPRFSIRLRIALGFMLTFLLICIITIAAIIFIAKLGAKQHFLEKAGNYAFEIQQTRRFEKNYFLYGTDLYDALTHVNSARNVLDSAQKEFTSILGAHAFSDMSGTLERYRGLLESLDNLAKQGASRTDDRRRVLESEIRRCGAELVADASNAIDQERLRIHTWLHTSKVIAMAALVFILIFETYIVTFIARQIYRPFYRFENYMRRIAAGDFSPITPAKKYQDEFTDLALAINRMLKEILERGNQLVESRKMAAIGTLTAGIAHEINNPLNNISLTTEALINDFNEWTAEEKMDMLKDIYTQVERAGATVANLLDFTHRDEISFDLLSIKDVLESTVDLVKNELLLNNITFKMVSVDGLPRVRGHHNNLQQVFLNLFLNAIQAMPNGGELEVRGSRENHSIRIDVKDTGVGIPGENLEKIFDPFFTTKEVGKGTGLGLSVSFGIIEKHHGSIRVESEEGKGSTFTVFLPVGEETAKP
ncbi:MAG: two-component sensor histidine kinase [Deltaproteobacteria bacterium]|nr:MAG: two-component sensor histidine kinase [Deltaproteobacteria bacterium]